MNGCQVSPSPIITVLVDRLDPEPDVILLPHSMLQCPARRAVSGHPHSSRSARYLGVRLPVTIGVAMRGWCCNTDLDPTPPIQWPQVDFSIAHWSEDWKRRYLEWLGGKSYQQNLSDRSLPDEFSISNSRAIPVASLATMREWKLNRPDALDVKLADVMADIDGAMLRIFDHFGFPADESHAALEVARSEDIRRMDDAGYHRTAADSFLALISASGAMSCIGGTDRTRFEASYGDLIRELEYEPAGIT